MWPSSSPRDAHRAVLSWLFPAACRSTSNAVYERIGYRMVCESTEYAFSS